MKLTYYRKGDYLFPNLTIESSENSIGKYGMLRRTFLKENRSNWYQSMMLTGKLDRHLLEIEKTAQERMEILVAGLLQKYPAPDKEANPLAWASHMNMLTAMAEKCVMNDLVYR